MFDFGPTIEYTILVHDLLIGTLLAGFGVCCSNMGLEEHRRVQGRFFNNRNCGVPLGSISIGFSSFKSILDTEEVAMKIPNVRRGSLDEGFSTFVGSYLFTLSTFVAHNEGTLFRSSRMAPLVGPTSGDAVGLR